MPKPACGSVEERRRMVGERDKAGVQVGKGE